MKVTTFIDAARVKADHWGIDQPIKDFSDEHIELGCMLWIGQSLEKIADKLLMLDPTERECATKKDEEYRKDEELREWRWSIITAARRTVIASLKLEHGPIPWELRSPFHELITNLAYKGEDEDSIKALAATFDIRKVSFKPGSKRRAAFDKWISGKAGA